MKAFIVAAEFPYPANHGGRVDVWNRLLAFNKIGVNVHLLVWHKNTDVPLPAHISKVKEITEGLYVIPYPGIAKRLFGMLRYPSLAAARILDNIVFDQIKEQVKIFTPDFIFIDSIHPGATGMRFARALNLPVSLRLHNIEYIYLKGQYDNAPLSVHKLQLLATLFHLKKYEKKIVAAADHFFDISLHDIAYWQSLGFNHGHWLPPTYIEATHPVISSRAGNAYKYHVGFFGNLYSPNNVNGVTWFVNQVLPLVKEQLKDIRVLFIGNGPTDAIIALCKSNGITLISNAENIDTYLNGVNVLINPVQFSSGVNIKTVEMLFKENQVVSTFAGVKGLPIEIQDVFYLSNTAAEFADNLTAILQGKTSKEPSKRTELRKLFDKNRLLELLPIMAGKRHSNTL